MVDVNLSPAPSSGTTISFARSCGSLTTSSGTRTAPNVTLIPLKTSYQCAIGSAPNTSSRMLLCLRLRRYLIPNPPHVAIRRLHFDDVGAKVGQDHCGARASYE